MSLRPFSALAALLVACSEPRPAVIVPTCAPASASPPAVVTAPVVAATPVPAAASSASSASAATAEPEPPRPEERFYPGSDSARVTEPKRRYATAVLLFAPPRTDSLDPLARIETLALQPVLCTIGGRLHAGLRCAEAMPRRTTVRLTSSGADETMEVTRSNAPFVATPEDGPVTYPAPYAPACCSYKRCDGKTIPYRPLERSGYVFATSKTVLAVWPVDADLELDPKTPETDAQTAHGWKLDRFMGRKLFQIATADVDHDGRPETLVYEWWANDYGLDVFVAGATAPVHGVHCGNI
jgi:hypothetical protein